MLWTISVKVSLLNSNTMWIARDKNYSLWLYKDKPWYKEDGQWVSPSLPMEIEENFSHTNYFKDIKWQDWKPTELVTDKNATGKNIWIVRDEDFSLWLHVKKPTRKIDGQWMSGSTPVHIDSSQGEGFLWEVQWKDSEPMELILNK